MFYTSIKRPVPVPECSDAGQFARYSRIFLKSRCAVQRGRWQLVGLGAGQWTEDARVAGQGARARQYSAALTEPCLAECGRGHVEPVPWPALLHSPAADIGSVTFDARVPGPALINGNTTFFSPRVLFWSPHRCIIVNKCPYSGDTLYHVLQFYIDTAINTQNSERRLQIAIGTTGSTPSAIFDL